LPRFVWHPFEPRQTTQGMERYIDRGYSVSFGSERVTQFVE
jgi:hypothetical protein